uniref:Uncharacterized protein n=1 Tax=Picea glauca TaxID=3330 RepID=A0A124GPB1_PICGL|nr:hypothetical protein ABT39_MTgene1256 [Picea glauca]
MINPPAIIIKAYCFSKVFYMQVFNQARSWTASTESISNILTVVLSQLKGIHGVPVSVL